MCSLRSVNWGWCIGCNSLWRYLLHLSPFSSYVEKAFKKLSEKESDVIMSDLEMPMKSGLDFLKALKQKIARFHLFRLLAKDKKK
jgi:DNA-binding NarL/FixJ family response regulator